MKSRIVVTTVLTSCLWFSGLALADADTTATGANMQGMDMPHMDMKSMKKTPAQQAAAKDKKCLDQHQGLMDKPATKNAAKCNYAHQYKMSTHKKAADAVKTAP